MYFTCTSQTMWERMDIKKNVQKYLKRKNSFGNFPQQFRLVNITMAAEKNDEVI